MIMDYLIRDAIIAFVQNNVNESQLTNATITKFSNYIYDSTGEYLIGGEEIANFIKNFINLYTN